MKDLSRRLIVSGIFIAAVIFILIYAFLPWVAVAAAAALSMLSAVAVWEYNQFARVKGSKAKSALLILLAVWVTCSFFLALFGWRFFPPTAFFISILILFAHHFRQKEGAIVDLAVSSFGLLYIALPIGMILGILYGAHGEDGRIWAAYLIATTKITDIGGYFGGSLWGRRKLAPMISPGKTLEGALFGLVLALVTSFVFYLLGKSLGGAYFTLGFVEWIVLGLILGCIGQLGDLSESLLKRDANKKDSNALPGLGGVLDAVDSLLFNAPIVYFFLLAFRGG